MLEQTLLDIIRRQLPYYKPIENPIKGLNNQYWIVFKHIDAENFLHNIVSFLGLGEKHSTHKVIRLDTNDASLCEYEPKKEGNIPNSVLLRTRKLSDIEKFLDCINIKTEESLQKDTFLELKLPEPNRFSLPKEKEEYKTFLGACLERTQLYRRATAYFNSGVLKLYEEPLSNIVKKEGEIRLLLDWQGFTNKKDLETLQKLEETDYRNQYIQQTLQEFLKGLEEGIFNSTTILAELVRLNILQIKVVKMEGIYHKKTGTLTDTLGNHIQHDGSDNFTYSAHRKNAESITLLYWNNKRDKATITKTIAEFDTEWDNALDLSQEFLKAIITEHKRRKAFTDPRIDSFTPSEIPAGETVTVIITGDNLQDVQEITANQLITNSIETSSKEILTAKFSIDPEHPPQPINTLTISTTKGKYSVETEKPLQVSQPLVIPDFPEIIGFKAAIETILTGKHGNPDDFLYYLAKERPHLWNIQQSEGLDSFVQRGILFEHQKSGAQHCQRVMNSFGVVVCADAVGLGKTRLAAAVGKLYREENGQIKIAIIAAKKLHDNWQREMSALGFRPSDYELYNKNLLGRKSNFLDDFNRYGGADLVLIDEAHEGIRNYNNRIHKACLQIRERDRSNGRQRYFLLLTATPWNNRREDIYNILFPFISKPEAFREFGFRAEIIEWFNNRDIGLESFTDNTEIFRKIYKELFLQRTRKMLQDATPDLNFYAKRLAQWLPVNFEPETENALDRIFGEFENSLYIPSADPIRYLTGTIEQRSLLANQRRVFLQRAESSMYALRLTIRNFSQKIKLVQERLETVSPDAEGLEEFLLLHYNFANDKQVSLDFSEDEDEDEEEENTEGKEEKRQQLKRSIEKAITELKGNPEKASKIYNLLLEHCQSDLSRLATVEELLKTEFIKDHKRLQVMQKVAELVNQGHKVLLISVFSDTVIDYYRYMQNNTIIAQAGIGMAIGGTKRYMADNRIITYSPHNIYKAGAERTGLKRTEIFSYFAPFASSQGGLFEHKGEEIAVLIGSETLSVGQNLQDANYLVCIDLPWNPMVLEQRIGRIDRPKKKPVEYITIYYANSESQLLRQATRLDKLHKKLIGDLPKEGGNISPVGGLEGLGASVYGDTLFDDEILPGYIEFIQSLVKVRKCVQENFQEKAYSKQESTKDIYTQNQILFSEELAKLMHRLGKNYQANPITIGQSDKESQPTGLAVLNISYFGPNGELITEQEETIYWNNLTNEQDGYGVAIATAFKTPQINDIVSAKSVLNQASILYEQLVNLKQQRQSQLDEPETLENITSTSERIIKIQRRLNQEGVTLPNGINTKIIRATLKNLNQYKTQKSVQKLLKDYTEGDKSNLSDTQLIQQLVNDTALLSLINYDTTQAKSLTISLNALLLRVM